MKITIALPAYHNHQIGGYLVTLMYANLLAERGHKVTVCFPRTLSNLRRWNSDFSTLIWKLKKHIKNRPLISSLTLNADVEIKLLTDLTDAALPSADILIATAWQTAEAMREATLEKGKKFYLLYDYEHWMTANTAIRKRIEATFTLPYNIISTSTCVKNMVEKCGGKVVAQLFCGLDFNNFGLDIPPQNRNALTVGFPIRAESFKGLDDAISAAQLLREEFGNDLIITAFGRKRLNVPHWINWLESPSQTELRAFYNANAIFMLPSHFEGWGLPGVEAMACGAALIVTDNGGSYDYAIHQKTAIVVPAKNPLALAAAVADLIRDNSRRLSLATSASTFVKQFSWESAGNKLDEILKT